MQRHENSEMSKIKVPQDKKRLSLLKDRRNSYGENSKSSRKNIPLSKQISAQNQRSQCQKLKTLLNNRRDENFSIEVEVAVSTSYKQKRLNGFKKCPDTSLNEHIKGQHKRRGISEGMF